MIYCDKCGKGLDDDLVFSKYLRCLYCNEILGENDPERILTKDGEIMFKG